ncbi:hypothetical protein AA21291_2320 [Swaminathania salitolerans LMG 21291]|uniref:Uncharacterized protein n=1 Tax=Swaminathania salitolerans TaxID=182838 RepID=A0A511BME7_9PROT|nr:hypothetical protein AA21291_2320 [Swaminathania salitolerans LMG 21291]GEL01509.1 hypothetical protein SSA02_06720 [Swaminathania salitolerans]
MLLHGIKCLLIDQARHRDKDDFADRLQHLGLGALVELMLADIGAPGQNAVKLTDASTSTVAGEDAVAVEMINDGLDAHRP